MDLGGIFRMKVNHWLQFKVPGAPHLHREASQESWLLAEQVLIGKEEDELRGLPRTP